MIFEKGRNYFWMPDSPEIMYELLKGLQAETLPDVVKGLLQASPYSTRLEVMAIRPSSVLEEEVKVDRVVFKARRITFEYLECVEGGQIG
jgi:hypothetical protein